MYAVDWLDGWMNGYKLKTVKLKTDLIFKDEWIDLDGYDCQINDSFIIYTI